MLEAAKICETAFAVTPAPGVDIPFPAEDLVMAVGPRADGQTKAVVVDNLKSFFALVHFWLLPWLGRQL